MLENVVGEARVANDEITRRIRSYEDRLRKLRFAFFSIIILFLLGVAGLYLELNYRSGIKAFQEEDFVQARVFFGRSGVYRDSNELINESYYQSAIAAFDNGRISEGRVELRKVLALNKEYKDAEDLLLNSYEFADRIQVVNIFGTSDPLTYRIVQISYDAEEKKLGFHYEISRSENSDAVSLVWREPRLFFGFPINGQIDSSGVDIHSIGGVFILALDNGSTPISLSEIYSGSLIFIVEPRVAAKLLEGYGDFTIQMGEESSYGTFSYTARVIVTE